MRNYLSEMDELFAARVPESDYIAGVVAVDVVDYLRGPTGPISAILLEEYVEGVTFDFTVKAAWDFTEEQWAMFWLVGQEQGVGASRSQGFGRYTVTEWAPATAAKTSRRKVA